tara:strand:+ start:91 stop:390 length:300 start_codon:yes stop_codon:yes gene_type:complete
LKPHHPTLAQLLDPRGHYFEELVLLVDELEMELTIAKHGYHKDNAFADRSLEARLQDVSYRRDLVALLDERISERDTLEEEDDDAQHALFLHIRKALTA